MGIYYEDNNEVIKLYSETEIDKITQQRRNELETKRQATKIQNKEKIRKRNSAYVLRRRERDPLFKLKMNISNLIRNSFKRRLASKNSKTTEILGCTIEEFRSYIENQFKQGMSWQNYGQWELDHIVPHSYALTEEDALKLNHHTNFQPLWREENEKKSNKFVG